MKGVRCAKCERFMTYEMLNDLEAQELQEKDEFVCSDCIQEEMEELNDESDTDESDIAQNDALLGALYWGGKL